MKYERNSILKRCWQAISHIFAVNVDGVPFSAPEKGMHNVRKSDI